MITSHNSSTSLLFSQALKTTQTKTKEASRAGETREISLEGERMEAVERLEEVRRERDREVHKLQCMLKSGNTEIERLSALTNELTLVCFSNLIYLIKY